MEMTWSQRVTNPRRGTSSWFDARILIDFMDKDRAKIGASPEAAATGNDTNGWEQKTMSFLVPEGAASIKFMPALLNVASGTFDLDDMVLKIML